MKRISMLMLLAVAAYALTGCMVTDYPCIGDTENPNYVDCADVPPPAEFHDTRGWAHIIESSQTATDIDGDGLYSQWIPFVSQDATGQQMIVNTVVSSPNEFPFHDDRYAQGSDDKGIEPYAYAIYTNSTYTVSNLPGAERPGDTGDITGSCLFGPEYDEFVYDYQFGTTCEVADPDLSMLQAYFDRDTTEVGIVHEAGRSLLGHSRNGLSFYEKMSLLQDATVTPEGLAFTFDSSETRVTLQQGPFSKVLDLSIFDGRSFVIEPSRQGINANALARQWEISPAEYLFVAEQLNDFARAQMIHLTITYRDIEWHHTFAISRIYDMYQAAGTLESNIGGSATGGRRDR